MSEASPLAVFILIVCPITFSIYVLHLTVDFLRHFKEETTKDFYRLCLLVVMVMAIGFMWIIHFIVKREADVKTAEITIICIAVWIFIGVLMYQCEFDWTIGGHKRQVMTLAQGNIIIVPFPSAVPTSATSSLSSVSVSASSSASTSSSDGARSISSGQMWARVEPEQKVDIEYGLPLYSELFPLPTYSEAMGGYRSISIDSTV